MDEERNKILCKLLHDLAEGDKNALEGIYVITCRNLILVANRYFNNREDIKDAVQTFYCNLIIKACKFRHNKNAYAWLICVFKNEIKNKLKRNKIERDYVNTAKCFVEFETANETDYLENYILINEILSKLTPYERKIVEMKYIEGVTLVSMSKILHKPESTIRNHLNKIKDKFEKM